MRSHKFRALDGWRGACALLVAAFHFESNAAWSQTAFNQHAWRLVDFFFVLSGFVIAHSARERIAGDVREAGDFFWRRVARLWPLHLAVLAVFVALQLALASTGRAPLTGASARSLDTLPANILLVQAWGMYGHPTWNFVAWSISVELFAYIVFALLCVSVRERHATIGFALLGVTSACFLAIFAPAGFAEITRFAILRGLWGFSAGVLTHCIWRTRGGPMRAATAHEIVAVAAVIACVTLIPMASPLEILLVPLFAWTTLVFAYERGALSRVLMTAPGQLLGRLSYSIYLTHWLVFTLARIAFRRFPLGVREEDEALRGHAGAIDLWLLLYLGIVVVIARITYAAVERPGQRLLISWRPRRDRASRSTRT